MSKDATIDLFELKRCPVTDLAITRRPEWTNIHLVEGYSASFCVVGERILFSRPRGYAGGGGMPRFFAERERVLREAGLWDRRHCEVKDYSGIPLRHSRLARVQFTQLLKAEGDRGKLQGFFAFGGPVIFTWIVNVAVRLVRHEGVPCLFLRDYQAAILGALDALARQGLAPAALRRPTPVEVPPDKQIYTVEEIHGYVDALLDQIAMINWYGEGAPPEPEPGDPLGVIYGGLKIIGLDFKTTLEEKQAAQAQAAQAQRLAALGTLTAGVAHELNSPLTAVLGFAQRLDRELTDPEHRTCIEKILRAGQRMRAIIDDLSACSQDVVPAPLVPLQLNHVLKEVAGQVEASLRTSGIRLELELARDLPHVLGHGHRLQSLFLNILTNAQDALQELDESNGSTIRLESRAEGDLVRVLCQDNGPGMTEEVRQRALEPFFTTKQVGRGTGLGLYVCHRVVEEHNGTIAIRSASGQGTQVEVSLPRAPADRPR